MGGNLTISNENVSLVFFLFHSVIKLTYNYVLTSDNAFKTGAV